MNAMRAMKARTVEQVRWRSISVPDDIRSQARIHRMQAIAYRRICGAGLWDTSMMFQDRRSWETLGHQVEPATRPQQFIEDAMEMAVGLGYQRARLCQRSRAELGCHGLGQGDRNARQAVERCDSSGHTCETKKT